MRIFGIYKRERIPFEITEGLTVGDIKNIVREQLNMPKEGGNQDKKILTLNYSGTELKDEWIFSHLGIRNGVTVKIAMREEVKPVLFINCVYNQDVVNIYRDMQLATLTIADLKTFVSRKTGIPVGVFRLLNEMDNEMFDCHILDRYGVDIGDTINMVTWDGWNDFLKLATMGYTSHVMSHISTDEPVARYQMKVALHVAAHFGHVDLAVCLLRQGVRSDIPVGEHPTRQWCSAGAHKESLKSPIHVATENGQLGVLRTFVNHNVCSLMVKDADGLSPLNIALRKKQKSCASFLLTKQLSRVPINKTQSLTLPIYSRILGWCDKAKERVFLLQGQAKSSLKRRYFINGPLVSHGVSVDGFSVSQMNSKNKIPLREIKKKLPTIYIETEDPEMYFRRLQNASLPGKLRRRTSRYGKGTDKTRFPIMDDSKEMKTPSNEDRVVDSACDQSVKFPPLPLKTKLVSISQTLTKQPQSNKGNKTFITTATGSVHSHVSHSMPALQQTNSSPTFSQKNRDSLVTLGSESAGYPKSRSTSVAESHKSQASRKSAKRNSEHSHVLARGKFHEGSLSLPVINHNDTTHPYFVYIDGSNNGEDLAMKTLNLYEKYRGMRSREYAIKCMVVANSFKDKPWLERVRMAVSLNSRAVKHMSKVRPRSMRDEKAEI